MNQPVTLKPLRFANPECSKCQFYGIDPDMAHAAAVNNLNAPPQGICNRYPPSSQILMTPQGPTAVMIKQVVPASHWCGEFSAKLASG
jgi:hypothetical protein